MCVYRLQPRLVHSPGIRIGSFAHHGFIDRYFVGFSPWELGVRSSESLRANAYPKVSFSIYISYNPPSVVRSIPDPEGEKSKEKQMKSAGVFGPWV